MISSQYEVGLLHLPYLPSLLGENHPQIPRAELEVEMPKERGVLSDGKNHPGELIP